MKNVEITPEIRQAVLDLMGSGLEDATFAEVTKALMSCKITMSMRSRMMFASITDACETGDKCYLRLSDWRLADIRKLEALCIAILKGASK